MADHSGQKSASSNNRGQAWRAILFCVAMVNSSGALLFAADIEAPISGAIRRAKSIKSGRLNYRVESGVMGSTVIGPQRSPMKTLSFAIPDWIERDREKGVTLINRGDCFMRLDQIRQEDGT